MSRRVAVVLFNLGGPDGLDAVRPFLFNLFNDKAIIGAPAPLRRVIAGLISSRREKPAQANYALMGGASPLLKETRAQADALAASLSAELGSRAVVRVFIAMRYWRPFTEDTVAEVAAFAPDDVILLPLYPQYSGTTSGSSLRAWRKSYKGSGNSHTVCCYPESAGLIDAHARRIEQTWAAAGQPRPIRLLFSAHGLPERVIKAGDPYQMQIERTCAAVVAKLGPDWDWRICYQSRVGPMMWIGPSTPDAIRQAVAEGLPLLVVPIAFVSEHVETLVELDHDYGKLARDLGCLTYLRAPALSLEPAFIRALTDAAVGALDRGSEPECASGGRVCGPAWSKCPARGSPASRVGA